MYRPQSVHDENSPLNVQNTCYLDGNMKSKTGAQNVTYAYDGQNRLVTSVTSSGEEYVQEAFEYDAFNNRTKKTVTQTDGTYVTEYSYTQNNLLDFETFGEHINDSTQIQNRINYTYDGRGNLNTKTTLDSANTIQNQTQYTFDYLNRLTSVANGNSVYSYTYNGDNLRKSKTINETTVGFVLDGMNVVYELDPDNSKSYFIGNSLEGYLSGSDRRYYSTDPIGTVYSIYCDETSQYVTDEEYTYGSYGDILSEMHIDNAFRFAGEYTDDETGLIYLRNRYYDPSIGRFISEDPAMDGSNWYAYCGNNPMKYVDPSGLFRIVNSKAYDKYQLSSGNINNQINDYVSEDIKKMQVKLQELGYLDRSITWYGYFGEATLDAVNRFKGDKGLKNDTTDTYGVVGATTWAYLGLDFDVIEFVGYTSTNVVMNKGSLIVDRNIIGADMKSIYNVAKALKGAYKLAYGEEFGVTTKFVYWELVGHIFVDEFAEANRGGILDPIWRKLQKSTGAINIGVASEDTNRWFWDWISQ